MATVLPSNVLTISDITKRLDPSGNVSNVAELLGQTNEIIEDMVLVEANQPTSHLETIRTGLPESYFRQFNQGVPLSKSTTAQVTEPIAMQESRSYVDEKLIKLNGNSAAFRLSEEKPFIESMGQNMAGTIFNGNLATDPTGFSGFASRYNNLSAGNGQNIIDGGGTNADNASIYLLVQSRETVFCTYPKGSAAGLQVSDLGVDAVPDANGNQYQAARSLFQWDCGLVVKDWRYAVRIANIDMSDWIGVTGTQALTSPTNAIKLMLRAIARIPNINMGRPAFYCNRSVKEGLMIQALDKSSNALGIVDAISQFGHPMKELQFMGVPVRCVDQLGIDETPVT